MAQFDVLRTKGSAIYPLVVEVQADLHNKLATRVVVPLVSRARYALPATRLTPTVKVRDDEYVVLFPLIAAVPKSSLGPLVASLAPHRATLLAALDLLVTGS
jgi:toxin CcdB